MTDSPHYTYRVSWSPEDQEFVGTVVEFPSLSWLDASEDAAFSGIRRLVGEVLRDMSERGETPPPALADKKFTGKFQVRVTPDRHRELAIQAALHGVSMNRLVNDKLAAL